MIIFSRYLCYTCICMVILAFSSISWADNLNINTDYQLHSFSYTNIDFNNSPQQPDSASYNSQKLSLTISADLQNDVTIGSKITALGISGSSFSYSNNTYPFPKTDFSPFIENAYISIKPVLPLTILDREFPVGINLTFGKQNIECGDGTIISDNGTGFLAYKALINCNYPLPLEFEYFSAKVDNNVNMNSNRDITGMIGRVTVFKNLIELSSFQDTDATGTLYIRGSNSIATNEIVQKYYSIRAGAKEKKLIYQFEYAKKMGYVTKNDLTQVNYDGSYYIAYGKLTGDKTKLGKVSAHALLTVATGDDKPTSLSTDNKVFSSSLAKKYDGLDRKGYGQLFAATTADSFFAIPDVYSGIDTLNVGTDFSPLYGWTFIVDYFLFSASQGPSGAPGASGFERIFGAEYTLGIELNLGVKYAYKKNVDFMFSFARYTPPNIQIYWQKRDPATLYKFDVNGRF